MIDQTRDRKPAVRINDEDVRRLYHQGMRDAEIASRLDVTRVTVLQARKRMGLPSHVESAQSIHRRRMMEAQHG